MIFSQISRSAQREQARRCRCTVNSVDTSSLTVTIRCLVDAPRYDAPAIPPRRERATCRRYYYTDISPCLPAICESSRTRRITMSRACVVRSHKERGRWFIEDCYTGLFGDSLSRSLLPSVIIFPMLFSLRDDYSTNLLISRPSLLLNFSPDF